MRKGNVNIKNHRISFSFFADLLQLLDRVQVVSLSGPLRDLRWYTFAMSWHSRWTFSSLRSRDHTFIKNFAALSFPRPLSPLPTCWTRPPQHDVSTVTHWRDGVGQVLSSVRFPQTWCSELKAMQFSLGSIPPDSLFLVARQVGVCLNPVQPDDFPLGGLHSA